MTRVIVIDDDELVRSTFSDALARAGYDVLAAKDGREGMRLCAEAPVDVAVTDLLMPDQDGIETILELRRRSPHTRIIAVSGGGAFDAIQLLDFAGSLGADRVVQKPVDPSRLAALVSELVAGGDGNASGEPPSQ